MESLNVKNINDEKIFNVIDPNGQGEVVNRIRPISISINQKAETINDETDSTVNLSVYWNDTWKSILDLTFNDSLRQEYGKLVTDLTAIQKDIDMKQYKDAETKTSDFLKYVANLSSKYTAIPETQNVAASKNKFITIKAERNSVKATISDTLLNFMLKKFAKVNDLDYTKANECYRINRNSCIANDIALYFHSPELFQKQAYMTVVKDNKVVGSYKATYDQFCKLASKFDVSPQKLGYSRDKIAGYIKTAEVVMQNIFFDSVDEAKEWQEMVDEKKKMEAEEPAGEETTEIKETKTKTEIGEGKSESPVKEDGGLVRPSEDFASDEIPESEPRQQDQQGGGQNLGASRRINLLKKKAKVGWNAKPENELEEIAVKIGDEIMEEGGFVFGQIQDINEEIRLNPTIKEQKGKELAELEEKHKKVVENIVRKYRKEFANEEIAKLVDEHLEDNNFHTESSIVSEFVDNEILASKKVKLNKKAGVGAGYKLTISGLEVDPNSIEITNEYAKDENSFFIEFKAKLLPKEVDVQAEHSYWGVSDTLPIVEGEISGDWQGYNDEETKEDFYDELKNATFEISDIRQGGYIWHYETENFNLGGEMVNRGKGAVKEYIGGDGNIEIDWVFIKSIYIADAINDAHDSTFEDEEEIEEEIDIENNKKTNVEKKAENRKNYNVVIGFDGKEEESDFAQEDVISALQEALIYFGEKWHELPSSLDNIDKLDFVKIREIEKGETVKEYTKEDILKMKEDFPKYSCNKKAIYGDIQEQDIVPAKTETKVYLQSSDKDLDKVWGIKMFVDNMDNKDGMDVVEFTKIGLIDHINELIEEHDSEHDYGNEKLDYNCSDDLLKEYVTNYLNGTVEFIKESKINSKVQKKAEEQTIEEKIEEQVSDDTIEGKIGVGDIVTICIDKLEYPEESFKYTELIGQPLILMENDKEDINKVIVEQTEYPFQRMTVNKDDIIQYAELKGADVVVEDTDGDEMITTFEELPIVAKQCKIKSIHKAATKKKANLTKKAINSLEDVAGLIDTIVSDYDWYGYFDSTEVGELSLYDQFLADVQKDEKGTIEKVLKYIAEDDDGYTTPEVEQLKEYYNAKFGGK